MKKNYKKILPPGRESFAKEIFDKFFTIDNLGYVAVKLN